MFSECCTESDSSKEKRHSGAFAKKRSGEKSSSAIVGEGDVCAEWAREQAVLESTIERLQRTYDQLPGNTREEFERLVKERKEHMQMAQAQTHD